MTGFLYDLMIIRKWLTFWASVYTTEVHEGRFGGVVSAMRTKPAQTVCEINHATNSDIHLLIRIRRILKFN